MRTRTIIEYAVAALVVIILGALGGWFFFLRTQTQTTLSQDAARGFNTSSAAPFGLATTPADAGASPAGNAALGSSAAGVPAQLWRVANVPVAGIALTGTSSMERVRYVERASGYVFEADPQNGSVVRLTNTLMPKTYEALFTTDGHIIERGLDQSGAITTFAGVVSTTTSATTSASTLQGVFLGRGIDTLVTDPSSGRLFYLVRNTQGVAGIRSEWNGGKQQQIFSSALTDWRLTWLRDGRITLSQSAADGIPGYAYTLQNDGTLSPILSGLGLTVLARTNSSALLYGTSSGGLSLFAQASTTAAVIKLPLHTIADKCVWTPGSELIAYCAVPQVVPSGNFLDNWYEGVAHPSDAIWKIDARAGTATLFYTPDPRMSVDVLRPSMDADGKYIAFINATDATPWILRLAK